LIVAAAIIGFLALWFGFGLLMIGLYRHDVSGRLTTPESDLITIAGRDWFKTGRIDRRYIDELEALGNRKPGFWRKMVR